MMARRSRLAIVSERPVTDQDRLALASQALDEAEAEHVAPPNEVLEALRSRNVELARVADAAMQQANDQRDRAQQLTMELDRAKTDTAHLQKASAEAVAKVRADASEVIAATQQQAHIAEKAAVAAGLAQRAASALCSAVAFLVDRAPVLGTLTGAYLLAHNLLPEPSITQLALLGIYGTIAILPAVWLSVRKS
jgi:hypothetical protein